MKAVSIILAAALICVTCACSGNVAGGNPEEKGKEVDSMNTTYQKISAEEAKIKMDEGGEYILLDVRTEEEFKAGRIDGAILIPVNEIKDRAEEELEDKDALILVYCRSGRRSAAAAEELASLGYTNVCDFGGIISWPYDTVTG